MCFSSDFNISTNTRLPQNGLGHIDPPPNEIRVLNNNLADWLLNFERE